MVTPVIDMSDANRDNLSQGFAKLLADTCAMALKARNYHWNIEGPNFISLHAMFEAQYRELDEASDVIAERIRALSRRSPGGFDSFKALTSIQDGDPHCKAEEMIHEFAEDQSRIASTARKILPFAEQAGDVVSVDLLTERLRVHEKTSWVLHSLLA